MVRNCVVIGGLLLATGFADAQVMQRHAPPANEGATCQTFFTKTLFDAFNLSDGKTLKGIEDFEESDIGLDQKFAIPAPLQGGVHQLRHGVAWLETAVFDMIVDLDSSVENDPRKLVGGVTRAAARDPPQRNSGNPQPVH